MDEKRPPAPPISPVIRSRTRPACRGRARSYLALLLVAVGLYVFYHISPLATSGRLHLHGQDPLSTPVPVAIGRKEPVPLEAHIMSKCPDARDCLRDMILPAMQRVHDKVNFTLSFIGKPTEHNDGVECRHGPEECLGNIIELCAQRLYPDAKTFLGFTMCLTRDYKNIPQRSLIEDCALEHAIDFGVLNECATRDDGAFGVGMLRSSVTRSSKAGVTKSCTVRLDEEVYCVRDDGAWKDCPSGPGVNDLVIAIEKLYQRS